VRSLHEQEPRQEVEEDGPDPGRHPVRARGLEIPVDDDDGDDDGDDVHDEGEEEVLGYQRNGDRRRRKDLRDEQQEDDQSQQDRYAHRHLLARIRRQVEDADAEEGDEHTRDDEVDRVEERLASDVQRERDLCLVVSLDTVPRVVVDTRTGDDVPRTAVDVVAEVDLLVTFVPVEDDLVAVERPRTELHLALLLVEGKVFHVDRTGALVDRWRYPQHVAHVVDDRIWLVGDLVFPVGTAKRQ